MIERPYDQDEDPGPTNIDKPDPGPNEESIYNPAPKVDDDDTKEDEEGIKDAS